MKAGERTRVAEEAKITAEQLDEDGATELAIGSAASPPRPPARYLPYPH